jgi:hypothetical protein
MVPATVNAFASVPKPTAGLTVAVHQLGVLVSGARGEGASTTPGGLEVPFGHIL